MDAGPLLAPWTNFYVIIGSSAGALIGLQFVAIALISEAEMGGTLEIRAFGTPTIVHFCFVLLVAGILNAPWHSLTNASVCLALCGTAGVAYIFSVIRHARRQTGYAPDTEDWFWYVGSPLAVYAALLVVGILVASHPAGALFGVAGTALGLLYIGIHNAWDTVTFVAVTHRERSKSEK